MRGSEKQISWASEIVENLNKTFEATAKMPAPDRVRKQLETMQAAINSADYAGDIINLFKDIHFNGDVRHDLSCIMSVYKIAVPMTDGEKKILAK